MLATDISGAQINAFLTPEQVQALVLEVISLRDEIRTTKEQLEKETSWMGERLAEANARIAQLEKRSDKPTEDTIIQLNKLAIELDKRGRAGQMGVTYAEAGKILNVGKARICQLRTLIASDSRFNVA